LLLKIGLNVVAAGFQTLAGRGIYTFSIPSHDPNVVVLSSTSAPP
jgi:hypothetical protein